VSRFRRISGEYPAQKYPAELIVSGFQEWEMVQPVSENCIALHTTGLSNDVKLRIAELKEKVPH
jgi:hypothetical protein